MNNISNIPNGLILTEIKLILSSVGMSEIYHSFNFLTDIIAYMIIQDSDNQITFKNGIILVADKYNLSERTIMNGLNNILKMSDDKIKSRMQFNLSKNSTLNKIRVLKNHIIDNLSIRFD